MSAPASPLPLFELILADPVPVHVAAKGYGRSDRTIRNWAQEGGFGCRVGGGRYLSTPLCYLWAANCRKDVRDFVGGKPPSPIVVDAFERHGALEALRQYERKKFPPEPAKAARAATAA